MNTMKHAILAVALGAFALTGCSQETTAPLSGLENENQSEQSEAPRIPSQAIFDFNFGHFDTPESRAYASGHEDLARAADLTYLNWLNAAIRVLYLDAVIVKVLHAPATVLAVALHQEPTYEGEGTYLWSFDWQDDAGAMASIRLYGTIDTISEIVTWELVISTNEETPPLVDFLWFHGETSLVSDSGFFIFNERDGREVAKLSWDTDEAAATAHLTLENIDTESEEEGNFVRYAVDGDLVEVRVHDNAEAIDTVIEWNETTGAGSITAPDYNDGAPACWDEDQMDVECVEEAA